MLLLLCGLVQLALQAKHALLHLCSATHEDHLLSVHSSLYEHRYGMQNCARMHACLSGMQMHFPAYERRHCVYISCTVACVAAASEAAG